MASAAMRRVDETCTIGRCVTIPLRVITEHILRNLRESRLQDPLVAVLEICEDTKIRDRDLPVYLVSTRAIGFEIKLGYYVMTNPNSFGDCFCRVKLGGTLAIMLNRVGELECLVDLSAIFAT